MNIGWREYARGRLSRFASQVQKRFWDIVPPRKPAYGVHTTRRRQRPWLGAVARIIDVRVRTARRPRVLALRRINSLPAPTCQLPRPNNRVDRARFANDGDRKP